MIQFPSGTQWLARRFFASLWNVRDLWKTMTVVVLLFVIGSAYAVNPGFKTEITQKGIDYGNPSVIWFSVTWSGRWLPISLTPGADKEGDSLSAPVDASWRYFSLLFSSRENSPRKLTIHVSQLWRLSLFLLTVQFCKQRRFRYPRLAKSKHAILEHTLGVFLQVIGLAVVGRA